MKRILTAALMAAALSAPALAADMAPAYKAPMYAPASAANWTGFYVGINGGGGILNGDILDPDCFTCADTKLQTGFGTFGGQLGYNWQLSNFVLGLEGDLNWASAKKSDAFALDDNGSQGIVTLKMNAFGSVRGRASLAVDRTLVYVTGGPAWGHFNSSFVSINGDNATDHQWRAGLAAGAGVEYMLTNNLVLRGEYLFLDFLDSSELLKLNDNTNTSCGTNG